MELRDLFFVRIMQESITFTAQEKDIPIAIV